MNSWKINHNAQKASAPRSSMGGDKYETEASRAHRKDKRHRPMRPSSQINSLPLAADSAGSDHILDFNNILLKKMHNDKPMFVCPNGHVYIEMTHPNADVASDFLNTVSEPVSRPEVIHEYQLTVFSVYAAVSMGISMENLIFNLNKFSKNELCPNLESVLRGHGSAFRRVKLVLRDGRYYIEATTKDDLNFMIESKVINEARIRKTLAVRTVRTTNNVGQRDTTLTKDPVKSVPNASQTSKDPPCPLSENDVPKPTDIPPSVSQQSKPTVTSDISESSGLGETIGTDAESSSGTQTCDSGSVENVENGLCDPSKIVDSEIEEDRYDIGTMGDDDFLIVARPEIDTVMFDSGTATYQEELSLSNAAPNSTISTDKKNLPPTPNTSQSSIPQVPNDTSVSDVVYSFEIQPDKVNRVKEVSVNELHRPLMIEYDFKRDFKNTTLNISLLPSTKIRYYQERALRKMFSNGRARSGIIVLPCGAGKTLTGITAITTMRKSTIVLTSSAVAVDQWKRAIGEFTTVDMNSVYCLTSENKKEFPADQAVILISTYTMMIYSGRRSVMSERVFKLIKEREWGLLIFDEVQFAPAPAFRKINDIIRSHCKLGLTATLVREDDLILDLQWLIGPKLYEANWLELQDAGFLAKVQCCEVWCPMETEFFRQYIHSSPAKQRKLWVCNPNKLRVCEYLIRFHEARQDKIIVFSDNLFALREVACALGKPFVSGDVGMTERMMIINKFKRHHNFNTILLSKVGDNAIDIPCANVVIQISFNFASRRQEAQRLGRILRPKPRAKEEFNAFFYSVVSTDTQEILFADKRQQFIIDQGYAYKVLPMNVFPMDTEDLIYDDAVKQKDILMKISLSDDQKLDIENDDVVLQDSGIDISQSESSPTGLQPTANGVKGAVRENTSLAALSGMGPGTLYKESAPKRVKKAQISDSLHPMFKQFLRGK